VATLTALVLRRQEGRCRYNRLVSVRVGIDLVSVAAVEQSLEQFAERYLERIYSAREIGESAGSDGPDPARLAARFAAKEAAIKVLRPATDQPVPWRSIEVRRSPGGWPELALDGAAAELAEAAGLDGWSMSLTHENGYACAVVLAEVRP
jgi:holo-[acyl-carrier protein] synthase